MNEQITLSREEMQKVFQMWNDDWIINPSNYDKITSDDSCACGQTSHFNALLKELREAK